jgi:WD40 repeat protein
MNQKYFEGKTAAACLGVFAYWAATAAAQGAAPQKQSLPIPVAVSGSRTIECVVTCGPTNPISALAFSPDGKKLVVGGYHEVVVWDLEAGKFLKRIGAGQLGTVGAVAFLNDGQLAVGEGTPYGSGSVRVFNVDSGQQTHSFEGPADVVSAIAVSPDGKLLAAGGGDALARVWNTETKELVTTLEEHKEPVSGISFSRDGKLLATASVDKTVQVWNVEKWDRTIKFREKEPVHGAVFGADPRMVFLAVSGEGGRSLQYRRTDNVRSIRSYSTGTGMPLDIVGSTKTNRMYAPCSDGIVRVYDVNGRLLASLSGHNDWAYGVAVSADGSRLASGDGDGTVKLWNLADNKALATLVQLAPGTDEWLVLTAPGYLAASSVNDLRWKTQNVNTPPDQLTGLLQKPELVQQAMAGTKVAPPAIE